MCIYTYIIKYILDITILKKTCIRLFDNKTKAF